MTRTIIPRADVYFNLHSKVWSVRDLRDRLVKEHAQVVVFSSPVEFVVSESGRQRVIREKRKNVHAFVRGNDPYFPEDIFWNIWKSYELEFSSIKYNPYKGPTFTCEELPVNIADAVVMLALENSPPKVVALNPRWKNKD